MTAADSDYLTTEEVASEIRMTPAWVAMQCKVGNLRATKLGSTWRVEREALREFMAGTVPTPRKRLSARQSRRSVVSPKQLAP